MTVAKFNERTEGLIDRAGLAPLPAIEVAQLATDKARIWIKPEWDDPYGPDPLRTIKRAPACLLAADILEKRCVAPGRIVITATTGNLGIEIGLIATREGFPLLAVVPEDIPVQNLEVLLELGVDVIQIDDGATCPSESAALRTRAFATDFRDRLVNVDQYSSWINPLAHAEITAREVFDGFDRQIDHLITPIGSCGTVCGFQQYLRATARDTALVGVQPEAGRAIPGTHVVAGDGGWPPENYSPIVIPRESIFTVDRVEAYAFTAKLWACGVPAGPSTGLALAQAWKMVRGGAEGNLVVISPDSNFKYGDVILDSLREFKADIVTRLPELELDEAIDAYLEEMSQAYGLGQTLQRVHQCYPVDHRGRLFDPQDIHDVVWSGNHRASRATRRDAV